MNFRRKDLVCIALASLLFLGLVGCEFDEKRARDSIAVAKGVLEQAKIQYADVCKADPTQQKPCGVINKAISAHSVAIDALNLYCAGPGWAEGGPCNKQPQFESRAREALSQLDVIIADVVRSLK